MREQQRADRDSRERSDNDHIGRMPRRMTSTLAHIMTIVVISDRLLS
jgi:hypothetical protein